MNYKYNIGATNMIIVGVFRNIEEVDEIKDIAKTSIVANRFRDLLNTIKIE